MNEQGSPTGKRLDHLEDEPVFLVGAERSGTTLLRLMLDSHPEITFTEEFEYAVEYVPAEGWPDLAEYVEKLEVNRVFQLHDLEIDPDVDYPELVSSFLGQQIEASSTVHGATIHFSIDKILRIWPKARFIHIVRDPRDVARSAVAMSWGGTVWGGVRKWMQAQDEWQTIKSQISSDRYIDVAFHDLVNDYLAVLERICEFMSLDYTDEMLSYADRTDYKLPSPSGTTSAWKDSLSERQIRLVEARIGDRLEEAGFVASGLSTMTLSPRREKLLDVESKLKRPLVQANVLGWPLTIGITIVRQIGPAPVRAWFERRADKRINSNRKRSWS